MEEYVCQLYGQKNVTDVNEVRYKKLNRLVGPNLVLNSAKSLKKVDCALLPPCNKTPYQKLKRANYISMVWSNAENANPVGELLPSDFGWVLSNGRYLPIWYEGSQLPEEFHKKGDKPKEEAGVEGNEEPEEEEWSSDSDIDIS